MHMQRTAAIVGGSLHLFPGMGYAMMLETRWEKLAERIHEFLMARVERL